MIDSYHLDDQHSIRSTRSPIINSYYLHVRLKSSYLYLYWIHTHTLLLQGIEYLKFTRSINYLHLHVSFTHNFPRKTCITGSWFPCIPKRPRSHRPPFSNLDQAWCFLTFTSWRHPIKIRVIFAQTNAGDPLLDHVHHRQVAFCLITIRGCVPR